MLLHRCQNIWKNMRLTHKKLLLLRAASLGILFFASTANAEEFIAKYDASWSGITIGEMNLRVKEDAQNYEYHVGLNSLGLLKQFTQYKSTNISKGTFSGAEVIPTSYYTYWQRKKRKAAN